MNEDISEIIKNSPFLEKFDNSSILITGATGLIGSVLVKTFLEYGRQKKKNIEVIALARNPEKAKKIFKDYSESNLVFLFGDIEDPISYEGPVDYIIHGASVTSSKMFVEKPVETINTAFIGTLNILNLACIKKVKGFVYLSSLEVYGVLGPGKILVSENESGYIDWLNVRSSYSEGKRMTECLSVSYAEEYGVPVKIARLAQTIGSGVSYNDNRVFVQFARSIIEKKDIVLKTKGETLRNYCYITDAASAILLILYSGAEKEVYNVSNMGTAITIADMAKMVVSNYPESGSKIVFDLSEDACKLGYNQTIKTCLDSSKLRALGWTPKVGLEEAYDRLIQGLKISK